MDVKPGSRWKSAVCTAEVVITRPPAGGVSLECGGQPMIPMTDERPAGGAVSPDHAGGVLIGKRYIDDRTGLEALGSKKGDGSLSVDGRPLTLKEAKPLPSSD